MRAESGIDMALKEDYLSDSEFRRVGTGAMAGVKSSRVECIPGGREGQRLAGEVGSTQHAGHVPCGKHCYNDAAAQQSRCSAWTAMLFRS